MRINRRRVVTAAMSCLAMPALSRLSLAQTTTIRLGKQYGLPYLPQMVMERQKLIEKHAAKEGIGSLTAEWMTLSGPGALNDALLSGGIDIINVAAPSLATLWEKTSGSPQAVRALCAVQSMPYIMVTRKEQVKSIADFTETDKIALPTVKISAQAVMLQMAAAKQWGLDQHTRLDPLTISMSHPDAVAALLSGQAEVTAHYTVAPFYAYELAKPGLRAILKSYDTIGRPHVNGIQITTDKFYQANAKLCAAVLAAHDEANSFIKSSPRQAAEIYMELSRDKRSSVAELEGIIKDPDIDYTTTPAALMKIVDFMAKSGRLKKTPASWKEMFLPVAHGLKGT
ncbi:MAG: ABC transporter substrate-binding protein [Bacteroidota bacterium]